MACLQPVTTFSLEEDPSRAQRIVVLRIEYARQLEADGDVQAARAVYTEALRTFPFEEAQCPKLWEEAAALEERHGDLSQARQILQNAVRISKDAKLVDALLRLESVAERRGAYASHGDYVNRLREVYKEVLKVHTLVVEYWLRFAKLEEDEGQVARAQALLSMCAQSFSSEATRLFKVSISRRYDMLEDVDRVWARRVGLQRRCIKRAEAEGTPQEEEPKMDKLLYDLLESVWSDYRYEALHWRTAVLMETTEVPSDLGTTLSRALARWSEAVEGVHQYYASLNKEDSTHVGRLRSTFKTLIERERILLKKSVGLEEGKNSFDEAQVLQQWVKLLLSPLVGEWGRLEVLYGDAKSLEEVKSVASQSTGKKRTRLFKNRA
ncbi:hypothetical protein AGDE_08144 [Angomonas deanei]|nr:hypothetical protein AGDE_08144 [Angomonas deanei]|eukprot:EPY33948.1 hypothetical protein AGDE_08144 [Angomonas deanei]